MLFETASKIEIFEPEQIALILYPLKDCFKIRDTGGTYYRVTEVQTAEGMTLLTEPLFLGTLDASEHDITITACNNAGFALPFTGGAGFTIYILFAALMLGMGVYFCKKSCMKRRTEL